MIFDLGSDGEAAVDGGGEGKEAVMMGDVDKVVEGRRGCGRQKVEGVDDDDARR